MEIIVTNNDAVVTLSLSGWLDTQSAPLLTEEVEQVDESAERVILDFEKLEYISSAGIRSIVACYKKFKDKLELINVNDEVNEVFRATGLTKRLKIN